MSKTAFVSGASRGIGKAIAISLAKLGYNLHLTCRTNETLLLQLKKELMETYSIECSCYVGDISSYEFVASVFMNIDSLDVLINNAGISHIGLLTDMSEDEWNRVINTNLTSAFYTCKFAVTKMLKKHKGKIINISSVWGTVGASMEVAYSASKGGLNTFTKALAKELAPSNIQVNAIACGVIDTDMNRCFDESEREALIDEIPACRMGTPDEVAALVCQLSEAPAYLTGQILTLDGGWQ